MDRTPNGIGAINPFRYKGYYYDAETAMYYCQSRYYVPSWGRWLNADSPFFLDTKKLDSMNLFAYCGNNPISGYDPKGTVDWKKVFGWIAVGVLAVLAVGAIVGGILATGAILSSVLIGAGIGALVGIGGSIDAQGGFENADPFKVARAGGIGAGIGAMCGFLSANFSMIGQTLGSYFGYSFANMTHITSGVVVKSVFSVSSVMKVTSVIGSVSGGLAGSMLGGYIANLFTGEEYDVDEEVKKGIENEIPTWLLNIFRWWFLG